MLKIVYPICYGMDVHKTFIIATIAATNERGVTIYQTKRFSTFTKDLRALAEWLKAAGCVDVCMESTGKYWIPIYNIFESSCRITLTHPKYVKAIRGKKTDKKDSIWITDLHKHGLVPGSFIPPEEIRQIRDLIRYYFKLVSFSTSEKNRVQNSLTVSNIMLSSVVSDTFGKSASAIIDHLLDHPGDREFDFQRFLHRSMFNKADDIALAIDGLITPPQAKKISLCKTHFEQLNSLKEKIKQIATEFATPFTCQLQIIASVPGISDFSALAVLSEIGVDMSQFHFAKHLCS
jgi:transposase